MSDLSNKFLAWEIVIPFLILGVTGLVGYGALSEEVKHKAADKTVAVLQTKVENIENTTDDIKTEQKEQRKILNKIAAKIGVD